MTQENSNPVGLVSQSLVAGGGAIALILGWVNQLSVASIGGSGLAGSPLAPYYLPTYYLTIGGLGVLLIGLLLGMTSGVSPEKKKACLWGIIGSILCIVAMCIMFSDIKAAEGLKEAAKSAYLIIAFRAGLVFFGVFFFRKAFKKAELNSKKLWKVVVRISLLLLWISALIMFIPVIGDLVFALTYLLIGIILIVCFYPIITNN